MKKGAILLSILFSLTFAGTNQLQYDECKTDVYYANGINTSEPEAKKSKDLLKIKMKKTYIMILKKKCLNI